MLMTVINIVLSIYYFMFTAAGMADPLYGARAQWPAAGSMLQRGFKRSGSASRGPGPADQRTANRCRTAIISGEH